MMLVFIYDLIIVDNENATSFSSELVFPQYIWLLKELGVVLKRCFVNLMLLSLRLSLKNNILQLNFFLKLFSYSLYVLLFLLIVGCGASKKFTRNEKYENEVYKITQPDPCLA